MLRKAARAGALIALLVGCGGSRDRGPAWPKPHASETDGGESLASRQASSVAAIEEADDATPAPATPAPAGGAVAPAAAPAGKPDKPASDAPPPKEPDVLTTEDIIIEIED
jgi:hypothetical protein